MILGCFGKGGVGKSTCSMLIAHAFLQMGNKPCVLQVDQQYNSEFIQNQHPELAAIPVFRANATKIEALTRKIIMHSPLRDAFDQIPEASSAIVAVVSMCEFLVNHEEFDPIIIDFPPNHDLGVMNLPQYLQKTIVKVATLRQRIHKMFTGADEFLDSLGEMERYITKATGKLAEMRCIVICNPDSLAVHEALMARTTLAKFGYVLGPVILNRILSNACQCEYCVMRRSRENIFRESVVGDLGIERRNFFIIPDYTSFSLLSNCFRNFVGECLVESLPNLDLFP